ARGPDPPAGFLGINENGATRPGGDQRATPAPQHARRTARLRAECANSRRLAHPGLPGDKHEPATPRDRLAQRVTQVAENRLALQEPRAFRRSNRHHLILNVPFSPVNYLKQALGPSRWLRAESRASKWLRRPVIERYSHTIYKTFCRCIRSDAAGAFTNVCESPRRSKLSQSDFPIFADF